MGLARFRSNAQSPFSLSATYSPPPPPSFDMMVMLGRPRSTIRSASSPTSPKGSIPILSSPSPSTLPHPLLTPRLRPTTIISPSTLTPTMAASTSVLSPVPVATPSRKRKIIVDAPTFSHKRSRAWTELEYEEMLEEATLLREELELLVAVAADLCRDLGCDPSQVRLFPGQLAAIEEKMASTDDLTERQVREMCQQMIMMMKYLCQRHYEHFALVDMQDHLRESRDRFMRFICQYAAMIGLFR